MKLQILFILTLIACANAARNPITNIIVLMMENRSFDHLLGWLKQDTKLKIDGLNKDQTCPIDPNDLSKGSMKINRNGFDTAPDDPNHDFDHTAAQINNDKMDGFISDAINSHPPLNGPNVISMFDMKSAPIINTLAQEFAVFDKWFCSLPGPTDPNREFAMSGTANGDTWNYNGTLYDQQTYFDYLRKNGHTFAGYYQTDRWALGYFEDLLKPVNSRFIHELDERFYDDVAAGALPEFTWLQPRMNAGIDLIPTWQHPDAPMVEGERLIKDVYEAIRAGPKWEETLFIITYDEHGGFYDHVPPPAAVSPDDRVSPNGFTFDKLGIRVPTIVISPWIAKNTVISENIIGDNVDNSTFDSTSILATSNILLGLTKKGVAPMGERMKYANTFATIIDNLDKPRTDCPTKLPDLPPPAANACEIQRLKPLNDHLESELKYYCHLHYPIEQSNGLCPGRLELMTNQGIASDWLRKEGEKLKNTLKLAEIAEFGQ